MIKFSIVNMMFYGFHGYYEYEREQGQKFFFDVSMIVDDAAVKNEEVNEAVDTARIYEIVKETTENQRFLNLALLGEKIIDKVFEKISHAKEVAVHIRKPSVPISGAIDYVEVEIDRKRES